MLVAIEVRRGSRGPDSRPKMSQGGVVKHSIYTNTGALIILLVVQEELV